MIILEMAKNRAEYACFFAKSLVVWIFWRNFAAQRCRRGFRVPPVLIIIFMIDKQKIKEFAEEWLAGKEYFLVDATVDQDNKITVEIDHKDGVWIEDCCELSKFIEEHLDRDVEDFELEVGSAGIGQPFKVLQQYINNIGYDVELLTAGGKKMEGNLADADAEGFTVVVTEKQKLEGKKRPQMVDVEHRFGYNDVKWVKAVIDFK